MWGRDYSKLSRVFNTALDFVHGRHAGKVVGNIDWYADRFDLYNEKIRQKLAVSNHLPVAGQIPANLDDIFAFLDCTANEICRPGGPNAIQNAFWNGYRHGHFIVWQGEQAFHFHSPHFSSPHFSSPHLSSPLFASLRALPLDSPPLSFYFLPSPILFSAPRGLFSRWNGCLRRAGTWL